MSQPKYSSPYDKRLPETNKVDSRTKQMEFKRKKTKSTDQISGTKSFSAAKSFMNPAYQGFEAESPTKDLTFQPSKLPAIVDIMNLRAR